MHIAILGAGVAGVATAIALTQQGYRVSLYERQDSASTIGAGIVVWPNAAFVLEQLGVLADIAAVSGRPTHMRRLSSQGDPLGAIDIALINSTMGYASYSILRSDFQAILIERLKLLGVSIHYGHGVEGVENCGNGRAMVRFANGQRIEADVVIGADGRMASRTRDYIHGDNKPIYQGFINWIGVFESQQPVFTEIAVTDYWGVGERFGIVPISSYKAYWAGGIASAEIGLREPVRYHQELLSIFATWPQPISNVIEGTATDRINKIYVHDHEPVSVWHKGQVLMIGDAAHAPLPTSGQGACQALEDAWHLSNCLTQNEQNVEQAFVEFTALRREKTASIIMAARGFAKSLFNTDEEFCRVRNQQSTQTDYAQVARAMSRGWGQLLPICS